MVRYDLLLFVLKIETTTRGTNTMPFVVFWRDHLRSNLGIISGLGIICIRGSFAALYSTVSNVSSCTVLFNKIACHFKKINSWKAVIIEPRAPKDSRQKIRKRESWLIWYLLHAVCFHYTKPIGKRPVGITQENGRTFVDQTWPTKWNRALANFSPSFSKFPSELKRSRVINRFVKKCNSKFRLDRSHGKKWTNSQRWSCCCLLLNIPVRRKPRCQKSLTYLTTPAVFNCVRAL